MVEKFFAMRLLSQATEWSVVSLSHNERLNIDLQLANDISGCHSWITIMLVTLIHSSSFSCVWKYYHFENIAWNLEVQYNSYGRTFHLDT